MDKIEQKPKLLRPEALLNMLEDLDAEKKQAKEGEDRYRTILDNSPFGIYIINGQGSIEYVNPAMLKLSGDSYDQFTRLNIFTLSTYKKTRLLKDIKGCLEGKPFFLGPVDYFSYYGKKKTIRNFSGIPIIEDGERKALIFVDDITKLKEAEESLRHGEELLNNVGDIAQVGGWEMDMTAGGKAKWTKASYEIVEISEDKPIPGYKQHISYYLKEDRPIVEKAMMDLVKKNIPLNFEARLRTAKGRIKWVKALGKAERKDGKIVRLYGTLQDITERKKTQDVLQESQKKYESLTENTPDCVKLVDLAGKITYANSISVANHGVKTKHDIVGKKIWGIPPDNISSKVKKDFMIVKKGKKIDVEYTIPLKDGNTKYVLRSYIPIKDDKENITAVQVVCRNITEIKKAEQELRHITDNITIGLYSTIDGKLKNVNDAMANMFGYSKDDLIGLSAWNLAKDKQKAKKLFFKKAKVNDTSPTTLECMKKDGKTFWAKINRSGSQQGEDFGFVEDVTKVKELEDKYQRIINNTEDIIYSYSPKGVMTFISPSVSIYGYKPEEIIGKPVMSFIHPKDRKKVASDIKASMKTRRVFPTEFRMLTKDGSYRYAEELGQPVIKGGKMIEIDGVIRDITDRKIARERIQEGEEKFRSVFEAATDGILLADANTKRFILANPSICKMTGYKEKELLKLSVGDIHPKKDLPYVIDQFTQQLQGKITLAKDVPILRKDKKIVYCDVNSKVLKIGKIEALMGMFREVEGKAENK